MTKSARVSVRLEGEVHQTVEDLAREAGRPKSSVLRDLLSEAIRLRRCPGVLFVSGPTGRRPVIAGAGLDLWEVIAAYKRYGQDFDRLAGDFHWLTSTQLRSALAYYQRYPDEIDEEIRRQAVLTEEEARQRYPHLFSPPRR